ncbi:DNA-3-methyladenine glycosylase family protein [Candidatus Methylocalor cossyra]|uniref:DNA-3-methyladenine glycosylase II n=1 Tax=Candidatus Methylocalor cossyra TaxID=3108543 RepID=A0ABM9NH20_9GAMM
MAQLAFCRRALAPFRLDFTVWVLRRRADNVMDRWDGHTYRRVLNLGGEPHELAVTQEGDPDRAELRVTVTGASLSPVTERFAAAALDRLLGLQLDLAGFYRMAAGDAALQALAGRFRGVKPPRFPSLFEALVNGIACQQLTLTLGIRLLNRLTEQFGSVFTQGCRTAYAFPSPAELAGRSPDALRRLGFSRQKARAIVGLAEAMAARSTELEGLEELDDAALADQLCRFQGVGRWTAEYVLLRGLGRLGVFPGDDVGARGNLARWLGLSGPLDYAGVRRAVERWQPYAGLLYFHLLLGRLAEAGYLPG